MTGERPGRLGVLFVGLAAAAALLAAPAAHAATISVDILSDDVLPDGDCSLREAVSSANANANVNDCVDGASGAVDLISLDASGTYQLSKPGANEDNNASGDLDFTAADAGVRIEGDPGFLGFPQDIIDGGDLDRVLHFEGEVEATIDGVQIRDGASPAGADGGGILASGSNGNNPTLTVEGGSVITSNLARGDGGGIDQRDGRLTVRDSRVTDNAALGSEFGGRGGGIAVDRILFTIERSLITGNILGDSDGEAASLPFAGGGIFARGTGAIAESTIADNTVIGADPGDIAEGGGLSTAYQSDVTVRGSTVSENLASAVDIARGGGIHRTNAAATFLAVNSTISGNDVADATQAVGGGMFIGAAGSSTQLLHLTVAENGAPSVSGIHNPSGTALEIRSSVIDQGVDGCAGAMSAGALNYNVDAGTSCVGVGNDSDLQNWDPQLSALGLYGGPTATHRLGPTSAINMIGPAQCKDENGIAPVTVDQRGAERPFQTGCEPGAYESVTCDGKLPTRLGGPGDDTIVGTSAGVDVIVGSAGNDVIDAREAQDFVCGGSGDDTLTGGAGPDWLEGGTGADSLLARDSLADARVDCGPGFDSFSIDAGLDQPIGCEADLHAVNPPGPPATSPPSTPTAKRCKKKRKKGKSAVEAKKRKKCKRKKGKH